MPTAFVLGSGQIGFAIAERLLNLGWDVTLANRRGPASEPILAERNTRVVALDRNEDGALEKVIGSGTDFFVDTIAYTKDHARQLLGLQRSLGSMAVISSASVYCDAEGRTLDETTEHAQFPVLPEPMTEEQTTVAPSDETYSTRKVAIEQLLLEKSNIPVAVIRPCAVYGIRSRSPREWCFVRRVLDGRKRVLLAFQGRSRFHTSATANIAEAIRVAAQARFHGALNVGDPQAPSVAEIARIIADALAHEWELIPLEDRLSDTLVGQTPWSVPLPFVVSTTKVESLGYKAVTSYPESVGDYCRWLLEVGSSADWREVFPGLASYPMNEMFNYEAEDRFLLEHM